MQYLGRGKKGSAAFLNNSYHTLFHPEYSVLNQASTCDLSEKSIPHSLLYI